MLRKAPKGLIANLGEGLNGQESPDAQVTHVSLEDRAGPELVKAFVDAVHAWKA